ncbi:MAG: DnaJ domain-containing protein [Hydrogenovibrio sp.]|uniref:DnaJ domain-containing protein n=1 Tax=Hydrogenovibrio TaxID=28884 RepID=UPI00037FA7D1|nr:MULTISPECIES: DnaJ domain-containing protein [Hydrogenovibrio]MDR9497795.1 DnaJ domain-containing protein [Hydrogenovibrio sp.]
MQPPHYDANIDYFALLGIHPQAGEDVIKKAYRKMARRYHPDVSTIHNAKEKFQEIAEAYEVLSKHRDAYWRDFCRRQSRFCQSMQANRRPRPNRPTAGGFQSARQEPIDGRDREITYPLTLRYAIRLLKLGYFYIPGLKVRMKFTREAFMDKTFRLKGKGYKGLFGGRDGDYLVRFELRLHSMNWRLEGSDLYGTIEVPKALLVPGTELTLQSPSGRMQVTVPEGYSPEDYIKVCDMGLPGDERFQPGDLYARLIAA